MYSTAALLALAGVVSAHMEMSFPAPFNSKYNPYADSGSIDYSMTAPLLADGSNYPCKGYQSVLGTDAGQATASFGIGEQGNITLTGGASHGGGSCQISLSTDGAKTFTVIQSIIGNCPVQPSGSFDFTIPSDAPAGDAVLAWSWNNRVGNREMYMNCAAITLTGGSSSKAKRDDVAFADRPEIFVANVGNGCVVPEGGDVKYPSPGPDVSDTSDNPEDPTGSCGASSGSSSSSSGGSSDTSSAAASSSTQAAVAESTVASSAAAATTASSHAGGIFATVSGSDAAATTSEAASPDSTTTAQTTATTLATVTKGGSSGSDATATASGSGSSATGSAASGNSTTYTAGTACTDEGAWNCLSGGTTYQRCASGAWTPVQDMAAGMTCKVGKSAMLSMVAAPSKKSFRMRRNL